MSAGPQPIGVNPQAVNVNTWSISIDPGPVSNIELEADPDITGNGHTFTSGILIRTARKLRQATIYFLTYIDSSTSNMASHTDNMSPSKTCMTPTGGGEDDDSIKESYAGAKRRIASLEDQLSSLKEAVKKRKSYVTTFIPCTRYLHHTIVTLSPT